MKREEQETYSEEEVSAAEAPDSAAEAPRPALAREPSAEPPAKARRLSLRQRTLQACVSDPSSVDGDIEDAEAALLKSLIDRVKEAKSRGWFWKDGGEDSVHHWSQRVAEALWDCGEERSGNLQMVADSASSSSAQTASQH